jgi:hypothetical protein
VQYRAEQKICRQQRCNQKPNLEGPDKGKKTKNGCLNTTQKTKDGAT